MKRTGILLALAAFLFIPRLSHAQISVGATLTGQSLVFDPDIVPGTVDAGTFYLVGTTLNAQGETHGVFRVGGDIRAVITRKAAIGVDSFGVGPRIAMTPPKLGLRPYAELLFGGAYVRSDSSTKFTGRYLDYTFVAGVDRKLTYHLDWRVFEYSHSTVSSEDIRNQYSTGVLFRFF